MFAPPPQRILLTLATSVMLACGARTGLDHYVSQRGDAGSRPAPDPTSMEPSTPTVVVESGAPPVLLPEPCSSRDAVLGPITPSNPTTPTMGPHPKGECGNGRHEEYESCDDANRYDGDGCDAKCQIEAYFICPSGGQPCVRLQICGDGVLSQQEDCDDGNLSPLDGCSASCQIEARCTIDTTDDCTDCSTGPIDPCNTGVDHCGDGIVQAEYGEACDRGASNTSAYGGCTESCTLAARCGDQSTQACGQETCDDGNRIGGDGCGADCRREQLWVR